MYWTIWVLWGKDETGNWLLRGSFSTDPSSNCGRATVVLTRSSVARQQITHYSICYYQYSQSRRVPSYQDTLQKLSLLVLREGSETLVWLIDAMSYRSINSLRKLKKYKPSFHFLFLFFFAFKTLNKFSSKRDFCPRRLDNFKCFLYFWMIFF